MPKDEQEFTHEDHSRVVNLVGDLAHEMPEVVPAIISSQRELAARTARCEARRCSMPTHAEQLGGHPGD